MLIDIDRNDKEYAKSYTLGVRVSSLNCSLVERWCLHVPVTALYASLNEMATGGDGSGRFGGESSGKSDVWKYFNKSTDGKKAECKLCSKILAYHGGTSNLRTHLQGQHPLKYQRQQESSIEKGKMKQETLASMFKPQACTESRSKDITDRIANMIALDMKPIRMVEGEGFNSLLAFLEPGYKIPSKKHFSKLIHQKHDLAKAKLCEALTAAGKIALTTDIWTSSATEAYLTVTVHYLSPTWDMHTFVLATQVFPEHHTGEEIAKELKRIVNSYSAREKVSAFVHDQAANMELCHRILSQEEGWESIFCSAHCLQLCLKEGLSITAIDRLLEAARKLVGHFHHSVVATEALKKWQEQMGDTQKKLVQDVATRLNSSLHMLERLLVTRWSIIAVLSDEAVTRRPDHCLDLKTEQWELAEDTAVSRRQLSFLNGKIGNGNGNTSTNL